MNATDDAKLFLRERIFTPVQESKDLDISIKGKVAHIERWVNSFPKVGDLIFYLDRFSNNRKENEVSRTLQTHNLNTFEDILTEFYSLYGGYRDRTTTFKDFVRGNPYSSSQILNLARVYDARSGGILPFRAETDNLGIVIKATLNGGPYQNEWLQFDHTLKYYMKSRKGVAKRSYKENNAVIESEVNNVKIYLFLRDKKRTSFFYFGRFFYAGIGIDNDGVEWFKLQREKSSQIDLKRLNNQFETDVSQVRELSNSDIEKRLADAPKKPKKIVTSTTSFIRNPVVVYKVLKQANGICECCNKQAPFKKRNGEWYLEVHHKVQLAHDGEDTVENAEALCPNCHREKHFGYSR
jgi:5-methylcytosine-specific restriction protein A